MAAILPRSRCVKAATIVHRDLGDVTRLKPYKYHLQLTLSHTRRVIGVCISSHQIEMTVLSSGIPSYD